MESTLMAVSAKTKQTKVPAKASAKAPAKAASSRTKRTASATQKTSAGKKPTVAQLQRERDALVKQLSAAEQRIAELESAHDQAINRIDWVIDSIQTVFDEKH